MSVNGADRLCETEFWDLNLTWNTDIPDFTQCFQNIVLLLLPCLCYCVVAIISLWNTSKSVIVSPLPWTLLIILKIAMCLGLMCFSIVEMGFALYGRFIADDIPDIVLYSSFTKVVTFAILFMMLMQHKAHGIKSSSILSIFWFIFSVCGLIMYRSSFLRVFYLDFPPIFQEAFILDMLFYPMVFFQFFLSLFSDAKDYIILEKRSPLEDETFFSFLTFHWFNDIILKGRKKLLNVHDFPHLSTRLKANYLWKRFQAKWISKTLNVYVQNPLETGENSDDLKGQKKLWPRLSWTLVKAFLPWLLYACFLEIIHDVIIFMTPLLLEQIIDFISEDEYVWKGYFYCMALFLNDFVARILYCLLTFFLRCFALQVKSSLVSAVYRKSLRISCSARRQYTSGELVNLISVDVEKVYDCAFYSTVWFGVPLKICLTIVFLWKYLGPSCLAGLIVLLLIIFISAIVTKKINTLQDQQMETKDSRLKHLNETLNGIKVLKLYAWEIPFMQKIASIREIEVKLIRAFQFCFAVSAFVWSCAPFFVTAACFVTYLLVSEQNVLDPTTVFVSLSLLMMLRYTVFQIPDVLTAFAQANVSLRRLRIFLAAEERSGDSVGNDPNEGEVISITEAVLSWEYSDEPALKAINLRVPNGKLVAVIGPVGSGKSSLLSAILGDMHKLFGSIDVKGTLAYVPQQAWILNQTVKDNVLFVKSMNKQMYNDVLEKCCLRPDLKILPDGDNTEIGEKGVNLSGGQKQRVSVARAVYQNADIYLLDDPLSALDAHVGKKVFENVIGNTGLLKKKTRILVTHNISVLPDADVIVTMRAGKIEEIGTYAELIGHNGLFANFVQEHINHQEISDVKDKIQQVSHELVANGVIEGTLITRSLVRRISSIESLNFKHGATLVEEERMEIGEVKGSIYKSYINHASLRFLLPALSGYLGYQAFEIGGNLWLSEWSIDPVLPDGTYDVPLRNLRIGVYTGLGICQGITIVFGAIFLAFSSARASKMFHQEMLVSIMKAPVSFFDTTPLGRIMNRFGRDMDDIDSEIPLEIDGIVACFLAAIGTFIVIGMNTPLFIAFLIPIGVIYYFIQKLYLATSRQIKRLAATTRSPVYSHFTEAIVGTSSIKAYNVEDHFVKETESKLDTNISCQFCWTACVSWLDLRLALIGDFLILITALLAVSSKNTSEAAFVGLALTYALSVTEMLSWVVKTGTELENKSVAIERIDEYSNLTPEAPWTILDAQLPISWPGNGRITFNNYSTRYREDLDLVLKCINLEIFAREKVGIVGRTGAGKSSFALALFRLIEPAQGKIIIDDVDVSQIGLHQLRSKLTIIPQDPVLFTGSLRSNLDPNNDYSDDNVWTSLEHAHSKLFVKSLTEGLNHDVAEGGENLSVGQRQLICLARALLKKTKILILDEATAAVDMDTDRLIQNTIRTEFGESTVITIAHRLNTILDYDKVVVMESGKIIEVGNPTNLLQQPDSEFYVLARDAGLV